MDPNDHAPMTLTAEHLPNALVMPLDDLTDTEQMTASGTGGIRSPTQHDTPNELRFFRRIGDGRVTFSPEH